MTEILRTVTSTVSIGAPEECCPIIAVHVGWATNTRLLLLRSVNRKKKSLKDGKTIR